MAPANNPNINHGLCPAMATPATTTGSELMAVANNGRAAMRIPSPRLDNAVANHSRLYAGPKDVKAIIVLRLLILSAGS